MSDYADNLRRSMINKTRRFMRMVQEMQEKDDAALREQVISMAKEAGFQTLLPDEHIDGNGGVYVGDDDIAEALERFFHLAAAAGANAALEAAARKALEASELAKLNGKAGLYPAEVEEIADAITALRAALKEQT